MTHGDVGGMTVCGGYRATGDTMTREPGKPTCLACMVFADDLYDYAFALQPRAWFAEEVYERMWCAHVRALENVQRRNRRTR